MARSNNRADHEGQLALALTGREGFEGPAEAKGLLSLAYVTRHLKESAYFEELVKGIRGESGGTELLAKKVKKVA